MKSTNKKELAQQLGISRSSLYYQSKMKVRDEALCASIRSVLQEHPSYGHRRLALELKRNKKAILRVMKKFDIKPYRRRTKKHTKKQDLGKDPLFAPNYAKTLCPVRCNVLWASDFTYFWYKGRWWYLCTVLDVFSREIVGVSFAATHDKHLVLSALRNALDTRPAPTYMHSDQGSEYQSYAYFDLLKEHRIHASFSAKSSPWQNGFQESFYSEFKKDLGHITRFETLGEFIEGLYAQLFYYNNKRIHTALRMPPVHFRQQKSPSYNVS